MPDSSGQQIEGNGDGGQGQPVTFEGWLAGQDETVKGLYSSHTAGLKKALDAERSRGKDLEKELRDAAKKLETGSDAQKRLTEMANQLSEATSRAAFYEGAPTAGVRNVAAAYKLAVADGLVNGETQNVASVLDNLKRSYPELFEDLTPNPFPKGKGNVGRGNAGDGTNNSAAGGDSVNSFIRKAAGYR